ncbi:secreted RxLR effector peptide protein, putative [Phytophthora infestans T30-4]|uniref:RxLR effector protein n=2 Tax=Phytophthora infestans TaxID=4787 RepID=D0N657_PHYIT|nr:secreted RxLR effector peptide protein, putative [Phytophthora infestans T30-4]EEY70548.1 secreted RxLR effector peptide protein, putative [Phytophthora infestans T30-4]KAF4045476.1 hypothetical protein GN244_ATG02221 [Phytophthora infestans]KAF4142091.1 hypothetical protein GN958_ATG08725 [Phytophthora infestans]|eukprot:XP_002998202.1 secreted RxLR effector peptide protein, putative [Phytophthora infestans T30-4]
MRLCYILTAVTAIATFAEGSSVTSQSNVLYPGKTDSVSIISTIGGERFLRTQEKMKDAKMADSGKVDEEERGMGLEKVLSQKTLSLKEPLLTKSKSMVDLSKIDDEAALQLLNQRNHDLYKEIEKMGYTPKSMKETLIARKGDVLLDTGNV